MRIGVHISIAGSIDRSVERALKIGCNTFQLFTRNPRGWSFSDIPEDVVRSFKERLSKVDISPVVDHMPYLPNLATPNDEVYKKSVDTLKAELERCSQLGIPYLVTHLGSHLGSGEEKGCQRLVSALNSALETGPKCMILLENTSGQKNSMGTTFEDIRAIMDRLEEPEGVGFCFDTCHAFAGGYDVKTRIGEVLDELDKIIGLERLKVVHLNDSKGDLGSHLDRHEHIGLGKIGEDGFRSILSDKRIRSLPLIMETPVDSRRDDRGNIVKVYELAGLPLPQ
ncbi:MAG: deoxyribonuclease IV [Candidatus Methanomethylicia archaeon]|jgi:deoxyribonuclease-4|nr:deoxyribonuclease IV [Candidatus Methanomethylicia archaeon]